MQRGGVYGVYLYSERTATKAERHKKRLRRDGYAAEVYAVTTTNGKTRYRIAIPYFASVVDARSAAAKMAKLYNIDEVDVGEL